MGMKNMLCGALLALSLLGMVGCASAKRITYDLTAEIAEGSGWRQTHERFQGSDQRRIVLEGVGEHAISVDIGTESGRIDLHIADESGKEVYAGTALPTSTFDVIVQQGGTYIVRVDAQKHEGGFVVSWA